MIIDINSEITQLLEFSNTLKQLLYAPGGKDECKDILGLCKNKQPVPFKKTAGLYLREVL